MPNVDEAMSSVARPGFGPQDSFTTVMNAATVPNGASAPYNGPVGRAFVPPRPSTATGGRPPPQRIYPNDPPPQPLQQSGPRQVAPPNEPFQLPFQQPSLQQPQQSQDADAPLSRPRFNAQEKRETIGNIYDAYYRSHGPQGSIDEMPDFRAGSEVPASHKRGMTIDQHLAQPADTPPPMPQLRGPPDGLGQQPVASGPHMRSAKSQSDLRARGQPQQAVFEMAGDAPPLPTNGSDYSQTWYPSDRYASPDGQQNSQMQQPFGQGGAPDDGSYNNLDGPPPLNSYALPPRSASATPYQQRPGFNGLPSGPGPSGNMPPPNVRPMNGMPPSAPLPGRPNSEGLPQHPIPVRAGLIPNSVASQAANKPTPVRSYNNMAPPQQPQAPAATSGSANPAEPQRNSAVVTVAELEALRAAVKANPNDQNIQLVLARRWVEASDVLVAAIPDAKQRVKMRERYILDAHKLIKKLVAANNSEAMFYLADCYGRGALGLETDNKEAFSLYQSAAKAGHPAAAYRTAVCCELGAEDGGGTRKDPLKAIQWYKRAATLGDTPAMYKMGMIQLKGLLGQPRSPREAIQWLQRAAERADTENPHALHELGLLYEASNSNDAIVPDEVYSMSLFRQAADLGYKFSQFRLGSAYEYGLLGCAIDARQSIMWYSRAAVQEEHQSELGLSGWYLTGSEGVLGQSDTEAYLWARKAAMAGLAKAEYAMGYFTEVGIGSTANLEDAKRWYWRAAGMLYYASLCTFVLFRSTCGAMASDPGVRIVLTIFSAQNFPKARERLEDLKKGGSKPTLKSRERISRSKVGKQNEGECNLM